MEEDIKILEKFIECDNMFMTIDMLKNEDTIKAIENLIARNKELEEENNYIKNHIYYKEVVELNYIPKSKVKEKIEELENQKPLYFEKQVIQGRIDLLQELIED